MSGMPPECGQHSAGESQKCDDKGKRPLLGHVASSVASDCASSVELTTHPEAGKKAIGKSLGMKWSCKRVRDSAATSMVPDATSMRESVTTPQEGVTATPDDHPGSDCKSDAPALKLERSVEEAESPARCPRSARNESVEVAPPIPTKSSARPQKLLSNAGTSLPLQPCSGVNAIQQSVEDGQPQHTEEKNGSTEDQPHEAETRVSSKETIVPVLSEPPGTC